MNGKRNSYIKYFVFMIIISLFFIACEKSGNAPQSRDTSVRFVFEKGDGQQGQSLLFNQPNQPVQSVNPGQTGNTSGKTNSFHKLNEITEAKVLLLDMSQWEDEYQFLEAWYSSGQYTLWDTTLWDSTKDYWNNATAQLNSYTGEFYKPGGEYNLNIQNGIASGTITVKPGLNYFLVCLRENQKTVFSDEIFWTIIEEEENTIRVEATPALYIQIYSPEDGTVFQRNQEIFFSAWAENELNYEDIPDSNYVWSSNQDGEIGRGSYIVSSGLSINQHRITLSVTTPSGISGSKYVDIEVIE